MKFRDVITAFGYTFSVPTNIQRIDHKHTHGWQIRFGRWQFFADHSNDGSGSEKALLVATEELRDRMMKLPARTGLRVDSNQNKSSDLPVGISGPIERVRPGRKSIQYYFQVTFPVAGEKPVNRSVYIATENTMTQERYDFALSKAIALREAGVRRFKLGATKAMRAEAQK